MVNHVHVILRNRPDVVAGWSDEEVAQRWWQLFPFKKTVIDCKILFLNTSPTIGTELYDEFRNKKSPCPDASAQNQTTKLPLSISFNQTTVAEKQLAEDLRHAGRGEPPVR